METSFLKVQKRSYSNPLVHWLHKTLLYSNKNNYHSAWYVKHPTLLNRFFFLECDVLDIYYFNENIKDLCENAIIDDTLSFFERNKIIPKTGSNHPKLLLENNPENFDKLLKQNKLLRKN